MPLTLRLYGAFRQYQPSAAIELPVALPATVAAIRAAAAEILSPDAVTLMAVSVFADDTAVLAENAVVAPGTRLGLLPPVSGG